MQQCPKKYQIPTQQNDKRKKEPTLIKKKLFCYGETTLL